MLKTGIERDIEIIGLLDWILNIPSQTD